MKKVILKNYLTTDTIILKKEQTKSIKGGNNGEIPILTTNESGGS